MPKLVLRGPLRGGEGGGKGKGGERNSKGE